MRELRGKAVADYHKEVLKAHMAAAHAEGARIGLGILLVGEDQAAAMYAKSMQKVALQAGFEVKFTELPATASQVEVEQAVQDFNDDSHIYGILPLMPMPRHIEVEKVTEKIVPQKDIDGLTIYNSGLIASGRRGFSPCTPKACMAILDYYNIPLAGKRVVVIGRSNVVGRKVAELALQQDATVTICHSRTPDLGNVLQQADIIIAAAGRAHMITAEMVPAEAVVIDVGINQLNGKTVGDVVYEEVAPKVSAITPVPGGVGSVTTTMILLALYEAYSHA